MNGRRAARGAARAAWAVVRQNRWRSGLTVAICGLGTAGVILAGAMGRAQTAAIQERLASIGGRLVIISPNKVPPYPGRPRQLDHFISLEPEDADALAAKVLRVEIVVPVVARDSIVRFGRSASRTRLIGTTPAYAAVRGFTLAAGRFFTSDDRSDRVIVVGHAVSRELSPQGVRPGHTVTIAGQPYEVVGILHPRGVNFAGEDEDHQVFIPLETYRHRIANSPWITFLYVQLTSDANSNETVRQMLQVLRDRHEVRSDEADDVIVRDIADVAGQQTSLANAALRIVSVTSALLLVLGVAGIATLMVQVVHQRRPEIGLRRAIGARPSDVAIQLFMEGMGLAWAGVLSGLIIGIVAILFGRVVFRLPLSIDPFLVALTVLLSVAVSGIACVTPAMIAARMEPAAALRA
jgi:putative ABC transport system permease protein